MAAKGDGLRLKRVELMGFKSFVDKTVLEFDEGITAILGPNGCGKSNIVDAIRWVLGEQSAKQLRGEKMEDIIFKGTAKRKPVTLAEVALTFTNEDRALPIDFTEVVVKRRVTRDGFSQYYLNDAPVRLRDLRDLFFDSGVNNTAYSVIEQEKISRVLSDNSQEVRLLIEEGAGIVKYKARRKEAQRKLDHTERDLLRLRDIIDEIGREVRSLQRQVGKARRYKRLYEEIRSLDLHLAGRAWRDMSERERDLGAQKQELTVLSEADAGELAELRAKVEATRPAVDEREAERRGLEESLQAFEEDLQKNEQKVLLQEQRIEDHRRRLQENTEAVADTCTRREEATAEIADLDRRRAELTAQAEALSAELETAAEDLKLQESRFEAGRRSLEEASQLNLEFIETDNRHKSELRELEIRIENRRERLRALAAEREILAGTRGEAGERLSVLEASRDEAAARRRDLLERLAGLERRQQDLQAEAEKLAEDVAAREARRESLRSRHEMLKDIVESYEGYGGAARAVLQSRAGDARVLGSLADRLTVAEGWTEAFEILLGDLLDAVVVDRTATAYDLVGELRTDGKGRAGFLVAASDEPPADSGDAPVGGAPARDLVHGDGAASRHLRRLLARTWTFADDASALAAASAHAGRTPIVCLSRQGLLVTSDGVVRGGRGRGEEVSLLGRTEKLESLAREIAEADDAVAGLRARREKAVAGREEVRREFGGARAELEACDGELSRLHVEAAESRSRDEAAAARIEALERDAASLEESVAGFQSQMSELRGDLDQSGRQRDDSSVRLDELRRQVASDERQRDLTRADVEHKRLTHSRRIGEVRELEAALGHLRESVAELTAGEERLRQEIELGRGEIVSLEEQIVERRNSLTAGLDERERRRRLVQASADAIAALHQETAVWYDRIKEIDEKRQGCRERIHEIETELATLDVRRANLVDRVEEQYKGAFRELIRGCDPEALPKELERDGDVFQPEQARTLLDERRQRLSSLGAVNHLAIEEYEQKKERLQFLEGQLADVEKARDDLESTIDRINRTARKLFRETFEEVRRNYVAVFQTLFEGGHADLLLERADDPLESDLRILAQPKGKRVDHIRLLSGGERCMTALALLFAVYLVKPSPFCLLDEADAPLDDANVHRFVKMLREFSRNTQFLVVTHNKLTMETANHLYGVTMMEQGVSSLVSVSFQDVADSLDDEELGRAIAQRRHRLDRDAISITMLDAGGASPEGEEMRLTLDDEPESAGEAEAAVADPPAAAAAADGGAGDDFPEAEL